MNCTSMLLVLFFIVCMNLFVHIRKTLIDAEVQLGFLFFDTFLIKQRKIITNTIKFYELIITK